MASSFHKIDLSISSDYIDKSSKVCPCCKEDKKISEFQKDRSRKDGRDVYCWFCRKMKAKPKKRILSEDYYKKIRKQKCLEKIAYWTKELKLVE